MKMTTLDTARKQLPQNENYEIDRNGFVYHRGKRLALKKKCSRWYAQIYDTCQNKVTFDSEEMSRQLFGEADYILRRQDIEKNFRVKTIPNFPRYMITAYGAIYCVDPPKRGRNAGHCYLVRVSDSHRKPSVNLTLSDGRRRTRYVDDLVKQAWG